MAHIVCITSGLTGILNSSFELVARLEKLGHRVTYGSPRDVRAIVEAQGITFFPLPSLFTKHSILPNHSKGLGSKVGRFLKKIGQLKKRRKAAFFDLQIEEYEAALQALKPDLVIVDIELHEFILTNFKNKIPQILLSPWFTLWWGSRIPPISSLIIPGIGFKGSKLGMSLAWLFSKWKQKRAIAKSQWGSVFADRRSALLQFAKKINFPRRNMQFSHWPPPFTYKNIPTLSLTSEGLEFPDSKKEWVHYLGPTVKEHRVDLMQDSEVKEQLLDIVKQKSNPNQYIIYCSLTTMKNGNHSFLKHIILATQTQPNWKLIIGTGAQDTNLIAETLPENVFLFPWVPQMQVLKFADCCINHGGINTINECIHFKVPMLIFPGNKFDQNGCAARVHFHQIGKISQGLQSPAQIKNDIEEVLTHSTYRDKMDVFHQHYISRKTSNYLSELINALLP